jgi:hypothetical protein
VRLHTFNHEERLSIFDRRPVFEQYLDDLSRRFRLDLVHKLHGLYNAQDLAFFNNITHFDIGRLFRRTRTIVRADNRRGDLCLVYLDIPCAALPDGT